MNLKGSSRGNVLANAPLFSPCDDTGYLVKYVDPIHQYYTAKN